MKNIYRDGFIVYPWQEQFLEIMADPTSKFNYKDFCKEYEVAQGSFYAWRKRFRKEISAEINTRRKEYTAEIRAKAWKALDKKLDAGSDKAIELCFKLIGDFVERSEQKIDYMRPEDKIERIKQLLSGVLEKKAQQEKKGDETPAPVDDKPNVGEGTGPA